MTGQRKLAAILAADIVGYSRLMGADEEGTLARFRALRRDVIDPEIAARQGRIFKTTGDGLLVEFASPVEAVRCAVNWQRAMAERNQAQPTERRIAFRIGVNLGDVIAEGGDIHGDGVNIAARLESMAENGGVCLSETIYQQVKGKLPTAFEDLGPQSLKNIAEPVRAYRVRIDGVPTAKPAAAVQRSTSWHVPALAGGVAVALVGVVLALWRPWGGAPAIGESQQPQIQQAQIPSHSETPAPAVATQPSPDRPTVAVLPFTNLSGDSQQDYLGDGIAEDLLTALTHFSRLKVVGRNSSFQYKGKSVDLRRIGDDLGARYVLEGSVRRDGERIRITAQLIEAANGTHLWADSYDRPFKDVFAFSDEVVRRVASAMAVQIVASETEHAQRKPPQNMDAYDLTLKARALIGRGDRESVLESRRIIEQAIAIDSNYALAHATLQLTLLNTFQNRWNDEYASPRTLERMLASGSRGYALDPTDPFVLARYASALSFAGRHDEAVTMAELAVAASPNDPNILFYAQTPIFRGGNPSRSIEILQTAMQLDPKFSTVWENSLSQAYFLRGEYIEGLASARRCVLRIPSNTLCNINLIANLWAAGRTEDSRLAAEALLRVSPGFNLTDDEFRTSTIKDRAGVERYREALRKAGVPEK